MPFLLLDLFTIVVTYHKACQLDSAGLSPVVFACAEMNEKLALIISALKIGVC